MEYQQFINFLKAKHCYNEFLGICSSQQCLIFNIKNDSIKEVFDISPSTVISNCFDWGLLRGEHRERYEFWIFTHLKWYDYFYQYG